MTSAESRGSIAACPCGLPRPYADCCGRFHAGAQHLQAPDAESLMRSRYSAFALGLLAYLQDTWHPDTRPAVLEPYPDSARWLGLQIRRVRVEGPDTATVEFVARVKQEGRATRLHELSRFSKIGGHWLYVDGDALP